MKTTIAVVLLTIAAGGLANVGDGPQVFEITWFSVDGGGGTSQGGPFEMSGTVGQPDAGRMLSGGFELTGGLWAGSADGPIAGDCDDDGDITLADYACFAECALGPNEPVPSDCDVFDYDFDADVDLADFAGFQLSFGG